MKKAQLGLIAFGIAFFCLIYLGLSTKSPDQQATEKSRAANFESTGIQNIVMDAKATLSAEEISFIEAMQDEYITAKEDSIDFREKAEALASKWYEFGFPTVSGYYAEEIAKREDDLQSWSIAGTTYTIGLRNAKSEKERLFAKKRAIQAFERAISMEPKNVDDQINLALVYVEAPDTNPMQGILMLRNLNDKFPENVGVMNQLARLALQTNQIDKALERLTTALTLEPDNKNSICLMANAQQAKGNSSEAEKYLKKCNN